MFTFFIESALTGELKITRLSTNVSEANGGEDVFLFVEKVGKSKLEIIKLVPHSRYIFISTQKTSKFGSFNWMKMRNLYGKIGENFRKPMFIISMRLVK